MSDGIKAQGTTLQMSTEVGSPQTFVTIGNVTDISRSGPERTITPTPNLSNTGAVAVTKLGGMLDEGEVTFTINYDPAIASHQALHTAMVDGDAREFKIILTDSGSAEIHFNGILRSFPLGIPMDDKVTRTVTVAITGSAWIVY